jgi:hypothetical protein
MTALLLPRTPPLPILPPMLLPATMVSRDLLLLLLLAAALLLLLLPLLLLRQASSVCWFRNSCIA